MAFLCIKTGRSEPFLPTFEQVVSVSTVKGIWMPPGAPRGGITYETFDATRHKTQQYEIPARRVRQTAERRLPQSGDRLRIGALPIDQ